MPKKLNAGTLLTSLSPGDMAVPVKFEGRRVFSPQPISSDWFSSIFSSLCPLQKRRPLIAIAVSGGGDSMGLVWLMRQVYPNLLAIVIDHGLRPHSASQTAETVQNLRSLGIKTYQHTLKNLHHGKKLEQRAREVRYRVLFDICHQYRCQKLMIAHQADDQVETIYKRLCDHSGEDGLAGMSWIRMQEGIQLIRPLLGVSRFALRQTLRHAGLHWFDDETNPYTQRGEIRRSLNEEEKERLWAFSMRKGTGRMQRLGILKKWLADAPHILKTGWVCWGRELPNLFIVRYVMNMMSGKNYVPRRRKLEALYKRAHPFTLGGMYFHFWHDQWYMVREISDLEKPIEAQENCVWDGRYRLKRIPQFASTFPIKVGAAGMGLSRKVRGGWPARFCATLPCLYVGYKRVAIPHLHWYENSTWENVTFEFTPPQNVEGRTVFGACACGESNYLLPSPLEVTSSSLYGRDRENLL